jgi:apolipoprotein N-acyltransferase
VDFLRAGFRAADFFLADVALAVRRFLVAAAFFPAATRLVDFLRAVVFFAVDFLRAGFLRVVVLFLVAAAFLAPALRRAVVLFLVAAAFFAAADRFADGRLRAAVFLAAIPSPFPSRDSPKDLDHDAIRLRRRRSRSLIPPHTPYRSSRRSA